MSKRSSLFFVSQSLASEVPIHRFPSTLCHLFSTISTISTIKSNLIFSKCLNTFGINVRNRIIVKI